MAYLFTCCIVNLFTVCFVYLSGLWELLFMWHVFKLYQHLCGSTWVRVCTQWYVQGVFVATHGFLWLPRGP